MTTGWRCPNCGKVYSPHVMECVPCNKAVDEAKKPKDNSAADIVNQAWDIVNQAWGVAKERVEKFNTSSDVSEVERRLKNALNEAQGLANEASRTFRSVRLFKSCPECGHTHHVDGPCISTLEGY